MNYLYGFWYICYYRQSAVEKAQFVSWQKEAAVEDCVQSPPAQHQRNGFVFFTKDRLSRHDMVDDGMPCSDSMTVMAFLLPSMTTWPDLFFQTDRGMCVVL